MEICTVGGFEEVGKNMTAVKIKDDVFLFDCGFYLPGVIELQEESNIDYTTAALRRVKGIPDDRVLDNLKWRKQVKAAIINTLYSYKKQSNGSEKDVDKMLDNVLSVAHDKQAAVFVTTFSSHIERLNNIVKHAQKTHREIIVFGRSMAKYINCAMNVGKCPFYSKIKIVKYRGQINSMFKKIDSDRGKYLVICTGHQGEKNSILDRIANGATPFRFKQGDHLIFSSSVIPVEVNQESRRKLDAKLIKMGVELQKDIHVSGHGSRDSKIKLIKLIKYYIK